MMLQAAPRALKPAGLAQSLSAGRRLCPCSPQPYARAHRRLRSWPGALASGEASVEAVGGSPLDSGAAEVDQGISRTISDLDLVLGLQQGAAEAGAAGEEAAAVAALAATAAAATAEVEAAVAIPEEWAGLAPEERARREKLVRRRELLSQRQRELQAEVERHARRLAWHQQRLNALGAQYSQLAAQQQLIQEELDPEAAAAARAEQQRRRDKNRWQMILIVAGIQVALCLFGVFSIYQIAQEVQHLVELHPRC